MLSIREPRVVVHQAGVIGRVNVNSRGISDNRIGLGRLLKGGIDFAVRSRKADDVRDWAAGRKRQKEVAIDGHLRMFLLQEIERGLSDRFERAARRRELES